MMLYCYYIDNDSCKLLHDNIEPFVIFKLLLSNLTIKAALRQKPSSFLF
jgi:hypothetical protein